MASKIGIPKAIKITTVKIPKLATPKATTKAVGMSGYLKASKLV